MITKEKKKEVVELLAEKLKKTTGLYLLNFAGMNVESTIALRRAFKAKGLDYKIAKNTLIRKALDATGEFDLPEEYLRGPSGIIFSYDDPSQPAKVLKEYLDKTKAEIPVLKAALIDKQLYDGSRLKELASLPSREDMIASIIGSIHAPISGIVGAVNAVMRDLAYLIEEVAKKKAA